MPESYAHKKMGAMVYKSLTKDTKALVHKHLPYFLVGLHGPDLLFFYRPGLDGHLREFGRGLHHRNFEEFYDNAKLQIELYRDDEKLVYFYGVLCHLYLDALCHPYVESFRKEVGVTHGKLETEYERHLLRKDGRDEQRFPVLAHLPISLDVAEQIAPFYLGVNAFEIYECMLSFKVSSNITRLGDPISRKLISNTMNELGYGEKVAGLLMSKDASEICRPAMGKLDALMEEAAFLAKEAIEEFSKYLYRDNACGKPEYTQMDFYGVNH